MEFLTIDGLKNAASVVGYLTTIGAFIVAACKPVRKRFVGFIRKQAGTSATEEKLEEIVRSIAGIKEDNEEQKRKIESDREATRCLLRNSITRVYYAYLPTKKIPEHEYKNVCYMSEAYFGVEGNSYIKDIVEQMHEWEIMPNE